MRLCVVEHTEELRMSRIELSPFAGAEKAFQELLRAEPGLVLDGARIGAGLPSRPIDLAELRCLLLDRTVGFAARDAALTEVVRRAQARSSAWRTALVGLLLPGLRRAAGRLARTYPGDPTDLDAEMLVGLLEELEVCSPERERLAAGLIWAAVRRALAHKEDEVARAGRQVPLEESVAPPPPGGRHPDLVLAQAVEGGVLSHHEAVLIGANRLEGIPLSVLAAHWGVGQRTLAQRRLRAERRLVAWICPDTRSGVSRNGHRGAVGGVRADRPGSGSDR